MKFAISTKNEVLKFGEVRSSSSLKSLFATQVWDRYKARLDEMQSTRSTTSEDLHKKVSDFKKTLVPEVAGLSGRL